MKISQEKPVIVTETLKKDIGKETKQLEAFESASQKNLKELQPSISKIANTLTDGQNVLNLDTLKIGEDGTSSINGEIVANNSSGEDLDVTVNVYQCATNNCMSEEAISFEVSESTETEEAISFAVSESTETE